MMSLRCRRLMGAAPVLMAAFLLVSCGSSTDTPTAPTEAATTTQTFSGTLVTGGLNFHPFAVPKGGLVTLKMVSISGLANPVLGAGLGTWDGTTCTAIANSTSNTVSAGWSMSGTAQAANFCAAVFDSGNVTAGSTATYSITITHPI